MIKKLTKKFRITKFKNVISPKILQVLPHMDSGGLVSGAIEMAKAIREAGGKSIIATSGGYRLNEIKRSESEIEILSVNTKNIYKIYKNTKAIITICKKYDVSLIHVRSRAPAWSCYWAAKNMNIPLVCTFHGTYGTENFIKKKYNKIMLSGYITIAISEFIKNHIKKTYGKKYNIKVIPRGVDTNVFSPSAVSQERIVSLAKKYLINESESILLMPGRLTSWKGHKYAIKALSLIKRKNVRLIIVGDSQNRNSYKQSLFKYAKKLRVEHSLSIFGHSRDIPAVMMLSDLVISCAEKPEAFGRVILEAQAMGRPIVAFNHGGAAELVKNNENGWLVEFRNVTMLAKVMCEVLDLKYTQRKKIMNKCIKNVRKNYLTNKMCNKTLELYEHVINNFRYEKKNTNN